MGKWRLFVAGAVGAVIALGVGFGVQSFATGSGSAVTYYGCIKAGQLIKVGTTATSCGTKTAVQINSYPESANGTPQCTGIPHVGIDLSGCDLEGADFDSANISNADLQGADLSGGATLQGNLSGANLQNANLADAMLYSATLENAKFSGASLNNANLGYATVGGAQFASASLTSVSVAVVYGQPASLPGNWEWIAYENNEGFLLGPTVVLPEEEIQLTGPPQYATPVSWSGADLSGARFISGEFDAIIMRGANLSGATIDGSTFSAEKVNGGQTTLYPDMSDVIFTNANLSGSTFAPGTDFAGATWSNTTCPDGTNSDSDGGTCVNNLT
jgi:uncharacterized protein YjbI with pentapeptide repeats